MSDVFSVAKMRSSLRNTFSQIGRRNGHAFTAETRNNIDPLLHQLFVDSEALSHFKKQRDGSLEAVMGVVEEGPLNDAIERVKEDEVGEDVLLFEGDVYNFQCTLNKPSSRVDTTMLRSEIIKRGILSGPDADELFDDCTKKAAPAKRFKVVPR